MAIGDNRLYRYLNRPHQPGLFVVAAARAAGEAAGTAAATGIHGGRIVTPRAGSHGENRNHLVQAGAVALRAFRLARAQDHGFEVLITIFANVLEDRHKNLKAELRVAEYRVPSSESAGDK